jgi:SAM-dependent methyltransferase
MKHHHRGEVKDLKTNTRASSNYLEACVLCGSPHLQYLFLSHGYPVAQCQGCRLLMLNPQPSDEVLLEIYSANYFLGSGTPAHEKLNSEMKRATARLYLDLLASYGEMRGRLLEVGCGHGDFLIEARDRGLEVTGVEFSPDAVNMARSKIGDVAIFCGEIDQVNLSAQSFDICVLSDVIEHTRNPVSFLETIHRLLKPGGILFVATPSLDSWSARLLRQRWIEFKTEHLFYFNQQTIQHLLFETGYQEVVIRPGKKVLSNQYIYHHFERFPVPGLTPLVRWAYRLSPEALRTHHLAINPSGMVAMARARDIPRRHRLSVIVPAYNEKATFRTLMDSLVQKDLHGLDIEIVVVESNSTDGTREDALHYRDHPRVRLVLEETPLGKGHAVRTGFEHIQGDFVLIQDADLEYDLNDYELLLEPLRCCREAFVLGSRHSGGQSWKIREFERQPLLSAFLNLGHAFFAFLLNLIYRQRLKDPFTMYKVFRRDCLYGVRFECNRFDFDIELVTKLVRKGYTPVEIPVNYRSRSFAEGKKISLLLDPLTWVKALFKYRFASLT